MRKIIETLVLSISAFVLLSVVSCDDKKLDPKLILGSWTMSDIANNTGVIITNKISFYENGSVCVEILVNGKLSSQFKGKYTLDTRKRVLSTDINDRISSGFEVMRLTEKELVLKDHRFGRRIRYIRY